MTLNKSNQAGIVTVMLLFIFFGTMIYAVYTEPTQLNERIEDNTEEVYAIKREFELAQDAFLARAESLSYARREILRLRFELAKCQK